MVGVQLHMYYVVVTQSHTFQMIYDVRRWKYEICMPHNAAFGIYETNNLTLKWLLIIVLFT